MNDEHDKLDELLHDWAQAHEPSPDRLSRLHEQLSLAASLPPALATPSTRRTKSVWRQPVPWISLLAALSILVAVVTLPLWKVEPARPPIAASINRIPQEHLQTLTAEMDKLFDHRLSWVAETNRDVSLGIEDSPSHTTAGRYVAVRVVVMHRDAQAPQWHPVWTGDVVSHSEQVVEVSSPSDGSQLKLWTHILPDGAMSVDTELALGGSGSAPWNSTSIQQPKVPSKMLSVRQGADEFEVWQTATLLGEKPL